MAEDLTPRELAAKQTKLDRLLAPIIEAQDRQPLMKLPADLTPVDGRVADLRDVEAWQTGAVILNWSTSLLGAVNLRQLSGALHRRPERVMRSIQRLELMGQVKAVKHQFRQNGEKRQEWRFTVIRGSKLQRMNPEDEQEPVPWAGVPAKVLHHGNVLATLTYLALRAQRRWDGNVTTTPGQLARVLGCSRWTVRRHMEAFGARPIAQLAGGRILYDFPLVHCKEHSSTLTVSGVEIQVRGHRDRQIERLAVLRDALLRAGRVPDRAFGEAIEQLRAQQQTVFVHRVIAIVNDAYQRQLCVDAEYRKRFTWRLFASRLTGVVRIPRAQRQERRDARTLKPGELADTLTVHCALCGDTGLIELEAPDGSLETARCAHTQPGAPPGRRT